MARVRFLTYAYEKTIGRGELTLRDPQIPRQRLVMAKRR